MPIEHRVDPASGVLRVRRWGSIESQDEEKACRVRAQDPLVVPGIPVLVDCTAVDPPDTVETVRYLADRITHTAAGLQCGPVAILVSTPVQYGMARMYMAMTGISHPRTQVFQSEEKALEWLRQAPPSAIDA